MRSLRCASMAVLGMCANFAWARTAGSQGTSSVLPCRSGLMSREQIRGGQAMRVNDRPDSGLLATSGFRVAFQGEPGAYSEKACRELLGQDVQTIGKESFEEAFQAVASREVDYALLPIENSLGGSIHANYDLLLRYNLFIVGEHTLRVRHCLLAPPGTKKSEVKTVMSHPQALAQCDNYLRQLRVKREPKYDTAGSAKYIKEEGLKGCAAIASDLAAEIYDMDVLEAGIEDDDVNYTRFLLLARQPVSALIPPNMKAKTTLVFLIDDKAGSLYRALACFALRDIDLAKCESRPTSVQLLNYLAFSESSRKKTTNDAGAAQRRFRYCFYLDYTASELDPAAQAALFHLREQSDFVRVLGSYPTDSQLVGPIKEALLTIKPANDHTKAKRLAASRALLTSAAASGSDSKSSEGVREVAPAATEKLRVGIVGFGKFGQYMAKTMTKYADVVAVDKDDMSKQAKELGVEFFHGHDMAAFMKRPLDVIILSVSILSFESVLRSMAPSDLRGKLIVDVCTIKGEPKTLLSELVPEDADILCTHPMFGPESAPSSWQAQPFVYEQVRVSDYARAHKFLNIFEAERCAMVEMSAELHDQYALEPQFVTHLVGRVLAEQHLKSTPIDTAGFKHAQALANSAVNDSFDLFFALYKHTEGAAERLASVREAVAHVEKQLAAKEAYLAAQDEYKRAERHTMLNEFRALIRDASHEEDAAAAAKSQASAKPKPVMPVAPKAPVTTKPKDGSM